MKNYSSIVYNIIMSQWNKNGTVKKSYFYTLYLKKSTYIL